MFGDCIDVGIIWKKFQWRNSIGVWRLSIYLEGSLFPSNANRKQSFCHAKFANLLYSLVELLLCMIFQIYLASEACILTLAYVSVYTYRAEINQLNSWVVSHCFALNSEPSCISDSRQKLIQNLINCACYLSNKWIGKSDLEYWTIMISNKLCF